MNKLKGFLKMKRGVLTLIAAVSLSVFAVAQLTNANNGCPEGQVLTSEGCVNKTSEATIPSGGDRAEPEPQPAPAPAPGESEPAPSQPSSPSCTE